MPPAQRPPRAAAAAAAALLLLATAAPCSAAWAGTQEVLGGACNVARVEFKTRHFEYLSGYASYLDLPAGCSPGDLQVSKLYMQDACSSVRDNEVRGCPAGVDGIPVSADEASCRAVYANPPPGALVPVVTPTQGKYVYKIDQDSIYAQTYTGYFFISNACNATLFFDLALEAYALSSGGLPSWARVTIGVVCGLLALALFVLAFRQCGSRRPAPVMLQPGPGVQMGVSPGGAPPPGGAGYYPDGPGPAGYPPAYAGAWGTAPGGGYGAPPTQPHIPPPMTTVDLSAAMAPMDGAGSGGVAVGTPVGGAAAAAGGTGGAAAIAGGAGGAAPSGSSGAAAAGAAGDSAAKV